MAQGTHAEIELKFHLADPQPIRDKLLALGFESHGQVFEVNVVLDTPALDLAAGSRLLRLRRDKTVRLTYKEPHADLELGLRFKAKQESELELADLETMRHILHRLGFTAERVYEKYREHFTRPDGASAELDRLPHMGCFLELEADPQRIESLAAELGLALIDGLRENYFALFVTYCRRTGLATRDMKFEDEKKPEPLRGE